MKRAARMLLLAGETRPDRQENNQQRGNRGRGQEGNRRGNTSPRQEYEPSTGNYPGWMPWYGDEPYMGGRERMPRRYDDSRNEYMGFGEREEPEARRGRSRTGRYKRANMGADEYEDEDRDEEEDNEPRKGHGKVMRMPRKLDEKTAHEWMNELENEDGSTGPHWSLEQAKQVAQQKNIRHEPLEFWVVLNMMYADYCGVAKKMNVNNVDFYVSMAQAFLDDKDAKEGKLYSYYEHIVK